MFEGEDVRRLAPRPPKVNKGRGGGGRRPVRAGVGAASSEPRRSAKKRPARGARSEESRAQRPSQRAKTRSGGGDNPWASAKPHGQKPKPKRQEESQGSQRPPSSKPKRSTEPQRAPTAKPAKPAPARQPRKAFKAPDSNEGGNRTPRRRGNSNKASSSTAAHY